MNDTLMRGRLSAAVLVTALTLSLSGVAHAGEDAPGPDRGTCPSEAEIFATDNTAIITDPDDPRLRTRLVRFGHEVRRIIRAHGAESGPSTLLEGVFWSSDLQRATYERSREFEVDRVGRDGLHHIAGVIAKRYRQESVLTFRCLPRTSPETDAVRIRAEGVSPTRLHDALVADPEARERLGGGSTTLDGQLVLVAPLADLALARKFTQDLGVDWNTTEVRYGDEEFVS
ncbi:hypothetical protein [Streptomyces hydrogenans]|uniref:Secreted protein n=1 Tax=Streptomyces hydrogenans TaxID=1873719 RepID=A0ABQ3PIR0_9ACTN|nr:hypothetical protein [Streptomyces hydrogenans]GHF92890.1 hypothetical protein GCM10018784_00210 [Streptomyces hydrogenans]GHI24896.1 hypothetical protein Shyd_62670 [Streptomyces hydrogenans]